MRTVSDIIKDCGGPAKIVEASAGAFKPDAVRKWPLIGIPDRHWPVLMRLTRVTEKELLAANLAARQVAA